jgi:hypothetical protein
MTYATVMAGLALDRSNDGCLEIAGQLAKRFGACAIGITAGEFSPPIYFTTGEQAQGVIDRGQVAVKNRNRRGRSKVSYRDAEPGGGRGMALRRGFSDQIYRPTGTGS